MIHDYRITFDLSVEGTGILLDVIFRADKGTPLNRLEAIATPLLEKALGISLSALPNVRVDDAVDLGEAIL